MSLNIGDKIPKFEASTNAGGKISNKDFQNTWTVLYFYPKDDTSGCTKEACSFNDNLSVLTELGVQVVGISPDSPSSHDKFIAKYNLNFKLISDEDHSISEAFGTWQEKSMYGRKYMGIVRTTYIIDNKGAIRHIFPKVNVTGHTEAVLEKLKELM